MDKTRRRSKSNLKCLKPLKGLFTHAPNGLYRVKYYDARIESKQSYTTKREYKVLAIYFEIIAGPYYFTDKGRWIGKTEYQGFLLPYWQSLKEDEDGNPRLSPNSALYREIIGCEGRNLRSKLLNWAKKKSWAYVKKSNGGPSKIVQFFEGDAPPNPCALDRFASDSLRK